MSQEAYHVDWVMPLRKSAQHPNSKGITKSTLKERKRRQFRNSMNIGDRELEPGWGYLKRFGSVVCTWAQAINLVLTDWWLRRLEKDDVGSVQLIEFLEWVLEQRRRRAARGP